jgi:hypothetical protein
MDLAVSKEREMLQMEIKASAILSLAVKDLKVTVTQAALDKRRVRELSREFDSPEVRRGGGTSGTAGRAPTLMHACTVCHRHAVAGNAQSVARILKGPARLRGRADSSMYASHPALISQSPCVRLVATPEQHGRPTSD